MATDNRSQKELKKNHQADIPPSIADLHCFTETNGVLTTTMFDVPGYRIVKVLGAVYGLTVRSRNWAAGLGMVLKSMAGGELRWFTNMVSIPGIPRAWFLCLDSFNGGFFFFLAICSIPNIGHIRNGFCGC